MVWNILADIGIGIHQLLRTRLVLFAQCLLFLQGSLLEEGIIEIDDMTF